MAAARAFGIDAGRALRWSTGRTPWSAGVLQRMADTVLENIAQRGQLSRLQREAAEVAAHADDIYAELDLLHRLTSQLHISESEHELWQRALGWLARTIPAQCLGIVLRDSADGELVDDNIARWEVLTEGESPADESEICELLRRFRTGRVGATVGAEPGRNHLADVALPDDSRIGLCAD